MLRQRLPRPRAAARGLRLLVLISALFVAACGGDDGNSGTPEATGGPATPPAGTGTAGEPGGGTPGGTPTEAGTPESSLETVPGTITTEDLNVRTGPGTEFPVIGRLQPGDEVAVAGYTSAGAAWLGLPGIGWTAYSEEWIDLPVPGNTLPEVGDEELRWEFTGPVHPPGTESGLPIVDEVVRAIEQHNRDALLSLVAAEGDGGSNETGGSGTEGDDGDNPATQTDCEGVQPASALEAQLDAFLRSDVVEGQAATALRLYAVVRGPASEDPDYVAVLAFEGGEGRQVWIAPDGTVTGFAMGCEPTLPGDMLKVTEADPFFYFRPPTPPPLDPVQ